MDVDRHQDAESEQSHAMSSEDESEPDPALILELQQAMEHAKAKKMQVKEEIEALQAKFRTILVEEQGLAAEIASQAARKQATTARATVEKELQERGAVSTYDVNDTEAERIAKIALNQQLIQECLEQQIADVESGTVPVRQRALRFLSPGDYRCRQEERIALASYPRCGNSLLRSIVERLTGIFTGSDSDPRRPLNGLLIKAGMMGEGMVDERVFAVKTHFPERLGRIKFHSGRAIIVVRNPFDALSSYFNMILTETHTDTILDDEFLKYHEMWDLFIREEIEVWKQFHAHWLSKAISQKLDLLVVRYEDMVQHRKTVYERIAKFLGKVNNLQGTEYESIVAQALDTQQQDIGVYTPRMQLYENGMQSSSSTSYSSEQHGVKRRDSEADVPTPGEANRAHDDHYCPKRIVAGTAVHLPIDGTKVLKSLRFFTEDQKKYILCTAKSELSQFGYWDNLFSHYGEAHIHRPLNACLVIKSQEKSTPHDREKWILTCNIRHALRPRTKDDPYGRGFGQRWRTQLDQLPPVQTRSKSSVPPS